jgi:porin
LVSSGAIRVTAAVIADESTGHRVIVVSSRKYFIFVQDRLKMNVPLFSSEFALPTGLRDWQITQLARIATFCIALVATSTSDASAQDCSGDTTLADTCSGCTSGGCTSGKCSCGGCHSCCGLLAGDLWSRDRLFGDVFGAKSPLAEHGIVTDFILGQYYQGVTTGGNEQTDAYGGVVDMYFTFLGEKFGLNKGFNVSLHAATRFGQDIDNAAGSLTLSNTGMLYPLPGDYHGTNITGLMATQSLRDGKLTLLGGKLNTIDLVNGFFPEVAGGREGFMNANAMVTALPWFRFINLSEWGGGFFVNNDEGQIQSGFLLLGRQNVSTTWDFGPSFDQGVGMFGFHKFFWEVEDKPGYLLVGAGGSTHNYTSLDESDWLNIPGAGPVGAAEKNPWDIAAYISQYLWQDPCNKARHIQFVTGGSIADDNPSFSNWNAFARIEGYGLQKSRPGDRVGFSGWYSGLSDDLKDLAAPAINVGDNWGVETYYNREITPWCHLTGDLQVLQNSNADTDTSLVLGMRVIIDL